MLLAPMTQPLSFGILDMVATYFFFHFVIGFPPFGIRKLTFQILISCRKNNVNPHPP